MKTRSETFQFGDKMEWEIVGEGTKRQIMAYDGHLTVVKMHFEQGSEGYLHAHYHTQGTFVASGKFEVIVGDKKEVLSAGDGFYAEPDEPHGVLCLEAGTLVDIFTPMRAEFIKK